MNGIGSFKRALAMRIWYFFLLATMLVATRAGSEPIAMAERSGPSNSIACAGSAGSDCLSPAALCVSEASQQIYIACETANQVAVFDIPSGQVTRSLQMAAAPLGLALSKNGSRLYVVCAAPVSTLCVVDLPPFQILESIPLGHTALSPVLSPDGKALYVCNRFNNDISVIDLEFSREVRRISVQREPVAAAITPDGKFLLVANHLHAGRANNFDAVAEVSVIDTAAGRVAKQIRLPLGSSLVRGVAVSPDGRFAAVTHLRSLYWLSTTSVELGRMNGNAVTFLDLSRMSVLGTLLLDQAGRGAANPWAVAWTPDGKTLAVSHAGSHEISLVNAPVDADPWNFLSLELGAYARIKGKVSAPPCHPVRVRNRLLLSGEGPRVLVTSGSAIYAANYFSDNLCVIDLAEPNPTVKSFPLGTAQEPSLIRRGEMLFNDARLCSQGWQSCASCHDVDARTDAINWDLLNDGIGNPKNTRSLVWAHRTGRAMALGVRANAREAVRAGIHHILFADQDEDVALAIDAWLESLTPLPSPSLVHGRLTAAAERGKRLFASPRTACAECHPAPLYTDYKPYNVGTTSERFSGLWGAQAADSPSDRFYTPALMELWRTAPYLHDGSAATLREVLSNGQHGHPSDLTPAEFDDLLEYLRSI